jgi:hypothetical protein
MENPLIETEIAKNEDSIAAKKLAAISIDPKKPLGHRSYGHIAHLPRSRTGEKDKTISDGQAKICCKKPRDKHDIVIVQEKLDGSNVSVAKIKGEIVPLIRAGYKANTSRFKMHHLFYNWAMQNRNRFDSLLEEGERCCGEWLLQAHGTIYDLPHDPFVAFDIIEGKSRKIWNETQTRCQSYGIITANTFHQGTPLDIPEALKLLGQGKHGAVDPVEGAVWRVERMGKVDFLAKYVRPEKIDGAYLPEISKITNLPIWNKIKGKDIYDNKQR